MDQLTTLISSILVFAVTTVISYPLYTILVKYQVATCKMTGDKSIQLVLSEYVHGMKYNSVFLGVEAAIASCLSNFGCLQLLKWTSRDKLTHYIDMPVMIGVGFLIVFLKVLIASPFDAIAVQAQLTDKSSLEVTYTTLQNYGLKGFYTASTAHIALSGYEVLHHYIIGRLVENWSIKLWCFTTKTTSSALFCMMRSFLGDVAITFGSIKSQPPDFSILVNLAGLFVIYPIHYSKTRMLANTAEQLDMPHIRKRPVCRFRTWTEVVAERNDFISMREYATDDVSMNSPITQHAKCDKLQVPRISENSLDSRNLLTVYRSDTTIPDDTLLSDSLFEELFDITFLEPVSRHIRLHLKPPQKDAVRVKSPIPILHKDTSNLSTSPSTFKGTEKSLFETTLSTLLNQGVKGLYRGVCFHLFLLGLKGILVDIGYTALRI